MRCASAPRAGLIAWRVEHRSRGRVRSVANHRGLGQVDDASRRPTRRAFEVQSSAAVGPSARGRARDASRASFGGARACDRDRSRRGARCVPRASSSDDREPSTSASSVSEAEESSSNEEKSLDARIWALALPAVASLLLDPVLGAVDTAFVGRLEGEGAAAALGGLAVSTTVFNFSFKLFNFLAVVTGPLVASQIAAAAAKRASTSKRATARKRRPRRRRWKSAPAARRRRDGARRDDPRRRRNLGDASPWRSAPTACWRGRAGTVLVTFS